MTVNKTTNLQLNKPDGEEYVRISDINDNMDKIDAQLSNYATLSNGTTATTDRGKTYGIAYKGNSTTTYVAAKWIANLNSGTTTLTDGMTILIKVPVAGNNTTGTLLSIDGGTTFHPVARAVTSNISTRYGVNALVLLAYNSIQSAKAYSSAGTNTTYTGIWVAVNDADDNNYSNVRQYQLAGTETTEYSLLARYNTVDKTGTYDTSSTRYSKDITLNASEGSLTATKFKGKATDFTTDGPLGQAIEGKVNKVIGKELSTNDYTTAEKDKLAGISAGAQVNAVTSVAGRTGEITLSRLDVGLGSVANVSTVNIIAQGSADNITSGAVYTALQGKQDTGDYALRSELPTVNNGKLTIQKNSAEIASFTANQSGEVTANITVPTKVSELTNDSNFISAHPATLSNTLPVDTTGEKFPALSFDSYGHTTAVTWKDIGTIGLGTYSKPSTTSAVANTDSISDAIGKLEKALDGKQATHTHPYLSNTTKYAKGIDLSVNDSTYVITAQLKDQDGNNLGTADTIDLPLESVVVNGSYDSTNKKVILTLKSGSTVDFSVADLISGLVSDTDSRLSNPRTPTSHAHGNIANDGTIGTASRVLISDANKKVAVSSVTTTTLGYLDATSSIQTQLNSKVSTASESLEGVTTTLLAKAKEMGAAGTGYKRWYTKSDEGSSEISDKPSGSTNGGFVCIAYLGRFVSATDYRVHLICYNNASGTNPYVATIIPGTTAISWGRMNSDIAVAVFNHTGLYDTEMPLLATYNAHTKTAGKDNWEGKWSAVNTNATLNLKSGIITAAGFKGNVTGNCSGSAGSVAWANVTSKPTLWTVESDLGSNYTMAKADFAQAYPVRRKVNTFASGQNPDSQNVGDYYLYSLGHTDTTGYATVLAASPRWNKGTTDYNVTRLYMGNFWQGVWKGWTEIVSTTASQALTNKTYNGVKITANASSNGFTIEGTNGTILGVSDSYILDKACSYGVVDTVDSTTLNLPTSKAVKTYSVTASTTSSASSAIADGGVASNNSVDTKIATAMTAAQGQWIEVYRSDAGLTSTSTTQTLSGTISTSDKEIKIIVSNTGSYQGMNSMSVLINSGFTPSSTAYTGNYGKWNQIYCVTGDGSVNTYDIAVQFTATNSFKLARVANSRLYAIYVRRT